MSLLDYFAHTCTILKPVKAESDEGGWKTTYEDGEQFTNHQAVDTTSEVRRAEQEGVKSPYSGLIDKEVGLQYGDYFRDEEQGITYRVTNIPNEKQAPSCSTFNLKFFTAERKEPPT